jgi:hypothetical protein
MVITGGGVASKVFSQYPDVQLTDDENAWADGLHPGSVSALNIESSLNVPSENSERLLKEASAEARRRLAAERVPTAADIQADRARRAADRQTSVAAGDQVTISPVAWALDRIHQLPEVRMDRVEAARAAIARNEYDDPQMLDIAVSRLLEDLAVEQPA